MEAHPLTIAGAQPPLQAGLQPRYFGEPDSSLYGSLTRAERSVRRRHGVLLCPPVGHEHVRSHWAFRQAAAMLARSGFDVLRFDWFGVGDSLGDLSEASVARWKLDLTSAATELREQTGATRISAVGLRLGATIAATCSDLLRLSALVLWDPVVDGSSYLDEQRLMTTRLLNDSKRFWFPSANKSQAAGELVGFDFGTSLQADINSTTLNRLPSVPVCLLRSSANSDEDPALVHLRQLRPDIAVSDAAARWNWTATEDVERMLLPGDAVRKLTTFLEGHA